VHWFEQVRLYASTAKKNAHLTNDQTMMLLLTASCKENCELLTIDDVFKALLALDPIQLPCSLEQYDALLLNAACLSTHFGDKNPFATTSVRAAPIDGERVWQCIKSEDDTLQEVSMFANEVFLDVIEAPAVILQENVGRVMVRVHDLIEEDLPDPERDKVGFLNAACFSIHSSKNPFATSVGTAPIDGEKIWQCIKSEDDTLQEIPLFANKLILDVTRLSAIILQENGERVKAQVIADLVDEDLPDPERDKVYPNSLLSAECMILITQCIRSRLQYDRSEIEEVMSCQQIIDYLYKSEKSKQVWKSQCISGCKRTITRKQKNYDDSSHNDVMLKCKNGEVDSAMCSIYGARDHDLSGKPGWKQFKKTVQQEKKLFSMLNQAEQLQSSRMVPSVLCVSFRPNVISNIHLNLNDAAITVYGKKLSPGLMILNAIQKVIIITDKHRRVTQWIQHDVGSYVSNA
jgi:hypothetical protein